MKKNIRILLFILSFSIALSVLVGCDDVEVEENIYGEDDEVEDFIPVDAKDYGLDFNLYVEASNGTGSFYMDEDGNSGSPMDEAVFSRQEKVQKRIGVEILLVEYPDATFGNYTKYIQTAVQNMDGTIDALITHVQQGTTNLISEHLITDLSEFEGINIDAEYWNITFMETLQLNGNYFLGLSDMNLLKTYVIGFNKEMLSLYESSMDKSIYDLVKDKEWTLDEMIKLANLVSIDKTGDGKSVDDTFGISGPCWMGFCGFLTSSNIPMMEMDQSGMYKIAINQSQYIERADTLLNKLEDLGSSNCAYFDYDYSTGHLPVTLSSGRTLMQVISTDLLPGLLDYNVEFGVLPFPMYDLDQASVGYKSLQWGGYIGVLSYLKNPLMTGETLELLAYYSENVKITFYEKLLGKQVADMPDDAAMLEIIWDSVATDVGQTFINAGSPDTMGVCYTIPHLMWPTTTGNLSSFIKGRENAINQGFAKFLEDID